MCQQQYTDAIGWGAIVVGFHPGPIGRIVANGNPPSPLMGGHLSRQRHGFESRWECKLFALLVSDLS